MARLVVLHARRRAVPLPLPADEAISRLASEVSEDTLLEMADRLPEMIEFQAFLAKFGIRWERSED